MMQEAEPSNIDHSIQGKLEQEYHCPLCPVVETSPEKLHHHVNSDHFSENTVDNSPEHTCPLCSDEFSSLEELQCHVDTSHNEMSTPTKASLSRKS